MKKFVVISNKGGVGKTFVAASIALCLSKKFKIGLLDLDLHGPNIPTILKINEKLMASPDGKIIPVKKKNLQVVSMGFILEKGAPLIWRGPLKMKAVKQLVEDTAWDKIDALIIDLPPGTGDEALSAVQLLTEINGGIVVTTPQDASLEDVERALNFLKITKVPIIGLIENMAWLKCPKCGYKISLGEGKSKSLCKKLNIPFLGSIPIDPDAFSESKLPSENSVTLSEICKIAFDMMENS